ncbi:MAG: hypothetical protein MUF04_08275 [Akkermansiaceae bacterium]|jgi:hypothetical protein|nr:hypothetical protein [Akkermansiaceae bacterium]
MTPRPTNGWVYGLISPETNPRLIRIDPASGAVTELGVTHSSTALPGDSYSLAFFTPRPPLRLGITPQAGGWLLNWPSQAGLRYQVHASPDLVAWQPFGSAVDGNGSRCMVLVPDTGDLRRFFRVGIADSP